MSEKGVMSTLSDYMRDVFDVDGDGIVSVKELFAVFPNMAIPIAIVFVDLLVLAAEYRVWQFGNYITGSPYLAIGFVLVSAVPFLLGQVFWLYPRATFLQKAIAIGFIGLSLYTSWLYGLADLTREYDQNGVYEFLVTLTVIYIVGTLVYIVFDPTIKATRMKRKAQDAAVFQSEIQSMAQFILGKLRVTLAEKKNMEEEFGADEVAQALSQLRGRKSNNVSSPPVPPTRPSVPPSSPNPPTAQGN